MALWHCALRPSARELRLVYILVRHMLRNATFGARSVDSSTTIAAHRVIGSRSGPARGPPEAPCAAPQCGNGALALRVAQSTDFPIKYG